MTTLVDLADAAAKHGGKSASLGALLRAGFDVPAGVVIPGPLLDGGRHRLGEVLADALDGVGPGPYAVRSSGLAEDGPDASFAGQLRTTLNVPPGALADAIARTAASAGSPAPTAYAARMGLAAVKDVLVIVQQMVAAEIAGVMFTRHPITGAEQVVVEATHGLGDGVVNGSRTPQRWTIDADTSVEQPGHGPAVLDLRQVQELATLGRRIESLFGGPQDIEWAIADGRIWILQSRPVTGGGRPSTTSVIGGVAARPVVSGIPASPGRVVGTPRVVADLDQFGQFQPGDILVCHATSPAWTPLLARASAVVTETGGILSHAAIVAREFGIPAVVAAFDAMSRLEGRGNAMVDGSSGSVTVLPAGEVR